MIFSPKLLFDFIKNVSEIWAQKGDVPELLLHKLSYVKVLMMIHFHWIKNSTNQYFIAAYNRYVVDYGKDEYFTTLVARDNSFHKRK